MQTEIKANASKPAQIPRLYTVEFLRIPFILSVIFLHTPIPKLLHLAGLNLAFSVEYFFIIGGFFLYNQLAYGTRSAGDMVKKLYMRLIPGMLFVLSLSIIFGHVKYTNVPFSLALGNGIGFHNHVSIRGGAWFLGVYFWVSCLFIGLFQMKSHCRWLWIGTLVYVCLMLHMRYEPLHEKNTIPGIFPVYGNVIISMATVRGIECMGLGIIFSFLSSKVTFHAKWLHKLIFTLFEIASIVCIYNSLWNTKHCHFSYIDSLLLMGGFMVSIAHSWGYVSTLLNKCSWIIYASRYTLPTLFGHMVCLSILHRHHHFGWDGYEQGAFVICGGILLGIIEYHLVEKWLVPIIKNHLHKHSSHSLQES